MINEVRRVWWTSWISSVTGHFRVTQKAVCTANVHDKRTNHFKIETLMMMIMMWCNEEWRAKREFIFQHNLSFPEKNMNLVVKCSIVLLKIVLLAFRWFFITFVNKYQWNDGFTVSSKKHKIMHPAIIEFQFI